MSARHLLASAVSLYSQYPWDDNIAMRLSIVTSGAGSKREEYFWWERSAADATDDLIRPLDQHNILSQEATSWTKEKCYNSDRLGSWVSAEINMRDIHLPSLFPSKKETRAQNSSPRPWRSKRYMAPQGLVSNLTTRLSAVRLSFMVFISLSYTLRNIRQILVYIYGSLYCVKQK